MERTVTRGEEHPLDRSSKRVVRGWRQTAAVLGPAAVVAVLGLVTLWNLRVSAERERWVQHTRLVQLGTAALLSHLVDAETAQRGFLITGDEQYLEPGLGATGRARAEIASLRTLTLDNPHQTRLDQIRRLTDTRLAILDTSIAQRRAGQNVSALALVKSDRGKALMDSIRSLAAIVGGEEATLLQRRTAAASTQRQWTLATLILGTALAVVLALLVNAMLVQFAAEQEADRNRIADQNETLEQQALELELQNQQLHEQTLETEVQNQQLQEQALELETQADQLQDQTAELEATNDEMQTSNDELQRTRDEAEDARTRLRLALEGSGVGMWDFQPLTGELIWDEHCKAAFGIAAEEPGRYEAFIAHAHPDDRERLQTTLDGMLASSGPDRFDAEFRTLALDGTVRVVRAAGRAIFADVFGVRQAVRLIGTMLDVTDRVRLLDAERAARAEAQEANRAKSTFLTTMSHELRTPLNAIGGYANLLEMGIRGPVTDDQAEDLRRIRRAGTHLLGLINDVLNYAKLEASTVHFAHEAFSVDELLGEAAAMVEPQARAKSIAFELATNGSRVAAAGDREKVMQIALNLLGNAVKFTRAGGRICLSCANGGDGRASIAVQDTGRGIEPEQLDRVFEPFVQVGRSLSGDDAGAGLGLSISRELARGMNGDLTVVSVHGEGSTFTLALPRAQEAPDQAHPAASSRVGSALRS